MADFAIKTAAREELERRALAKLAAREQAAAQPQALDRAGNFAGLGRSIAQGVTFGAGDEIEAYARSLGGADYDQTLKGIRGNLSQFSDENPGTALAADTLGGMATGGTLAKVLKKGGETALAAGTGFIEGYNRDQGSMLDRTYGGLQGAATNVANTGLVKGLMKAGNYLGGAAQHAYDKMRYGKPVSKTARLTESMRRAGTDIVPGYESEGSRAILGEMANNPQSQKVLEQDFTTAKQKISNVIGEAIPDESVRALPEAVTKKVESIKANLVAQKDALYEKALLTSKPMPKKVTISTNKGETKDLDIEEVYKNPDVRGFIENLRKEAPLEFSKVKSEAKAPISLLDAKGKKMPMGEKTAEYEIPENSAKMAQRVMFFLDNNADKFADPIAGKGLAKEFRKAVEEVYPDIKKANKWYEAENSKIRKLVGGKLANGTEVKGIYEQIVKANETGEATKVGKKLLALDESEIAMMLENGDDIIKEGAADTLKSFIFREMQASNNPAKTFEKYFTDNPTRVNKIKMVLGENGASELANVLQENVVKPSKVLGFAKVGDYSTEEILGKPSSGVIRQSANALGYIGADLIKGGGVASPPGIARTLTALTGLLQKRLSPAQQAAIAEIVSGNNPKAWEQVQKIVRPDKEINKSLAQTLGKMSLRGDYEDPDIPTIRITANR